MSSGLPELITNRKAGSHYNTADLNRVGEAVAYLTAALAGCGYDTLDTRPKTDWQRTDLQLEAAMTQYLENVKRIRDIFHREMALPQSMRHLTFTQANQIEKALQETDRTITEILGTRQYSGMIYAGAYILGGVI